MPTGGGRPEGIKQRSKGCERKRETALRGRTVEIPPFDITPFDRHLANLHETCGSSTPFCLRFKTKGEVPRATPSRFLPFDISTRTLSVVKVTISNSLLTVDTSQNRVLRLGRQRYPLCLALQRTMQGIRSILLWVQLNVYACGWWSTYRVEHPYRGSNVTNTKVEKYDFKELAYAPFVFIDREEDNQWRRYTNLISRRK